MECVEKFKVKNFKGSKSVRLNKFEIINVHIYFKKWNGRTVS
jgi:hypothetical protein